MRTAVGLGTIHPVALPPKRRCQATWADHGETVLDVEMGSTGQMIDDVRLAVEGHKPISYTGRAGVMPTVEEIIEAAKKALKEGK